jgi:hypothetical protein
MDEVVEMKIIRTDDEIRQMIEAIKTGLAGWPATDAWGESNDTTEDEADVAELKVALSGVCQRMSRAVYLWYTGHGQSTLGDWLG